MYVWRDGGSSERVSFRHHDPHLALEYFRLGRLISEPCFCQLEEYRVDFAKIVNGSEWTSSDRHTDKPNELIYRILRATLDKGPRSKDQWIQAILLVESCKLVPRPLKEGPRPKSGKLRLNLHGTCFGGKINWFKPKNNSILASIFGFILKLTTMKMLKK